MSNTLGPVSISRPFSSIGNNIKRTGRWWDRLISIMIIPILVRQHVCIEAVPFLSCNKFLTQTYETYPAVSKIIIHAIYSVWLSNLYIGMHALDFFIISVEYWVRQMHSYDTHHLASGVVEIPAKCPPLVHKWVLFAVNWVTETDGLKCADIHRVDRTLCCLVWLEYLRRVG